jgi:hypothetical protein
MPAAMVQMSEAIRKTVEQYGQTLKDLPDDVLNDFEQIVMAFALDLRDEKQRRHIKGES